MANFTVTIENTNEVFRTSDRNTVLEGMAALGRKGIPVGCSGGGCGVCKIEVLSGTYRKRVMSRAHISVEDEESHRVLACRIWATSDLRLKVIGKIQRSVSRGAPEAGAAQSPMPG
ncbi:MAG: 2Fe-2S iron-sulfur cluster binding domain-containing protein [Rhodocyclales bacterium]|nr:2Fe-2S iron-sulfur cluster binding domain-containing protein [Rhodocyclales bacterium]